MFLTLQETHNIGSMTNDHQDSKNNGKNDKKHPIRIENINHDWK